MPHFKVLLLRNSVADSWLGAAGVADAVTRLKGTTATWTSTGSYGLYVAEFAVSQLKNSVKNRICM